MFKFGAYNPTLPGTILSTTELYNQSPRSFTKQDSFNSAWLNTQHF